jgi:hypothetical protein
MTYLHTFFAEKNLPFAQWEFTADNGDVHIISNEVVIETILTATPRHEQKKIASVIRRIDFANGNVNHFLRHLAGALIN